MKSHCKLFQSKLPTKEMKFFILTSAPRKCFSIYCFLLERGSQGKTPEKMEESLPLTPSYVPALMY